VYCTRSIITIVIIIIFVILTLPCNPGHLASRGWSCLDAWTRDIMQQIRDIPGNPGRVATPRGASALFRQALFRPALFRQAVGLFQYGTIPPTRLFNYQVLILVYKQMFTSFALLPIGLCWDYFVSTISIRYFSIRHNMFLLSQTNCNLLSITKHWMNLVESIVA